MDGPGKKRIRQGIVAIASGFACATLAAGIVGALRSPLFYVRSLDVVGLPANAAVSADDLIKLAGVPLNQVSIFKVDLLKLETRVRANPWVAKVQVHKRLPGDLVIDVQLRTPAALVSHGKGAPRYIDGMGTEFADLDLKHAADLPLIIDATERADKARVHVEETLSWLDRWQTVWGKLGLRVSTLHWTSQAGARALVVYSTARGGVARTFVDLGDLDVSGIERDAQMDRLGEVVRYLRQNSITARQISADSGKKVVVRISDGS